MADTPSKSRKKKLRLVASGAWKKNPKTSLSVTASQRRGAKAARRTRNVSVTGAAREVCLLDTQAIKLGVYNAEFHAMNRVERKSIVSKALTEQLNAA